MMLLYAMLHEFFHSRKRLEIWEDRFFLSLVMPVNKISPKCHEVQEVLDVRWIADVRSLEIDAIDTANYDIVHVCHFAGNVNSGMRSLRNISWVIIMI